MNIWGLVPARGGSKSIPLKNLLSLAGRPLLDYVVSAAIASGALSRIICSTDSNAIAERARDLGIEVDNRPEYLAGDDVNVDDVARELLMRLRDHGEDLPDAVLLLQPTSPFLQPKDICGLIRFLEERPAARSVHNVTNVPHNLHKWNQRIVGENGEATFPFEAERSRARNKQQKQKLYAFGNLLVARSEALLSGDGFYAKPTYALEIDSQYAFDLDRKADIGLAEAIIAAGLVTFSHLKTNS